MKRLVAVALAILVLGVRPMEHGRPNLIAMTRCKVISVKDNVIEIESIDAFPDTPVLDIKS